MRGNSWKVREAPLRRGTCRLLLFFSFLLEHQDAEIEKPEERLFKHVDAVKAFSSTRVTACRQISHVTMIL